MSKKVKRFAIKVMLVIFESVILTTLWNCIVVKITTAIRIQQWQSMIIIIGTDAIVLSERTRKDI
jgi:hypothetical protein